MSFIDTVKEDKQVGFTEYLLLHDEAKDILKKRWSNLRDSKPKEKADIFAVLKDGKEIPIAIYIAPTWNDFDFPFNQLSLPEKRSGQINKGFWLVVFNRSLTRFILVRRNFKDIKPSNGKINIPLNKVEFINVEESK